jgi:hypothetical protein
MLLLLLALCSTAHPNETNLEMVLDRLVQVYGGEENLSRMNNMVQRWDMVAFMGNRHGTDTRSVSVPGKLRVVLDYGEKSETRILNRGTGFYVFSGKEPEPVNGMQLDAMQLQLMRLYSPLTLRNKIASIALIENGDLLALSLAENGLHVHYLVNTTDWRIEKVAGVLTMHGREVQFLTEYSDFKTINGVLMHQKENKFANGVNTAILQLREVKLDTRLDSSLFKP